MTSISRRFFLNIGIAGSALVYSLGRGIADTTSLSDVGRVLFAPA